MTRTTTATPDEPQDPEGRGLKSRTAREPRSRKRANGEGTIYQRKDGRYEGAAFVPTTAGTSKRVRVYGHTREDVRRQLTRSPRRSTRSTAGSVVQAREVLKVANGERLYALYVLALCLGLRRGELLGLRWQDADLETGALEVVQTLQRVGGALRFVGPKTENSARTIPLPPLCINALREHRRQQFTERADAWPDWRENGLVFPTRIGTPMEPDNLRRSWGRIRTTAGLTGTGFHDMRHTCVSLLLHLGVPPDMVREIVGHSDIEVTMTIYAHTSLDEKRQALGKLGNALA
jgi:integrase